MNDLEYMANFRMSMLLASLNPFQILQGVLQVIGDWAPKHVRSNRAGSVQLPIRGRWYVASGGWTEERSHSWNIRTQRYAYDFIMIDEHGNNQREDNDSNRPEAFLAFGAPIYACAEGVVHTVVDGRPDHKLSGTGEMRWWTTDVRGNYVVIKLDDFYSLSAHLACGSIAVHAGDPVTQETVLGRCGHSGMSSQPHLHFQLQRGPSFYFSDGVKISGVNDSCIAREFDEPFLCIGDIILVNANQEKSEIENRKSEIKNGVV